MNINIFLILRKIVICIIKYIFNIDVKYVNNINQNIFVEGVFFILGKDGVYVYIDVVVNFIKKLVNELC